jgi:hypothetical protein
MKRYIVLIQHEVIIYGENEKAALSSLFSNPFLKQRSNLQCVSITETPMPEDEVPRVVTDKRKAPGA